MNLKLILDERWNQIMLFMIQKIIDKEKDLKEYLTNS